MPVLCSGGHELLRTDPRPAPLMTVLDGVPEVLLVWVDVPLQHPHIELATVGHAARLDRAATVRGGDR